MRSRRRLAGMALAVIVTLALIGSVAAATRQFHAHPHGGEEVPPTGSRAQGQATFHLNEDGTELSYKLMVANIDNVLQAHIHCAPAGVNGGIIVWLYPEDGPPAQLIERPRGVLAEGTITDEDVIDSALCGATVQDLAAAIAAGNAYVNVHSTAFPAGEIRAQLR